MRMRRKKNGKARLELCKQFLLDMPSAPLSDPAAELGFAGGKVYLEIGAGKGGFACALAAREPDTACFAMEKVADCIVIAAERAASGEFGALDNLRFVISTADNLLQLFSLGTVDTIFLNFSDPWTKKGYAKRRLTHRRYLALYFGLLRDGGKIVFKTDNEGLFNFTLDELTSMGITPDIVTRDLHNSSFAEGNIMTEYEKHFSDLGMNINMLRVSKPESYNPEISSDFTEQTKHYYDQTHT